MEYLVNYKLAQLLKIDGFSELVNNYFRDNGMVQGYQAYNFNNPDASKYCSRPTIWEVNMWLKKKHNIWIVVDVLGDLTDYPRWNYKLVDLSNFKSNLDWQLKLLSIPYENQIENSFPSPTEAYQAAIENFYERKQNQSK